MLALADAAGLESGYWDIRGHRHDRTPETARSLLQALRIPAQSDGDIATSLSVLSNAAWRETVPPVIVAHVGQAINVPIVLNASGPTRSLRWSIVLARSFHL